MPHRALGSVGGFSFDLDSTIHARATGCHDSGEWARAALAPAHVIVVCSQSRREEHTKHAHTHKGKCSRTPAIAFSRAVAQAIGSRASDQQPRSRAAAQRLVKVCGPGACIQKLISANIYVVCAGVRAARDHNDWRSTTWPETNQYRVNSSPRYCNKCPKKIQDR